jgi:hypothetical protein
MDDLTEDEIAEMEVDVPLAMDPTKSPSSLLLRDAKLLLTNHYLPMETGFALNSEGMYHVAASTYMPKVTGAMIDWWFGWVTTTEQYKMWHPIDHEYSEWSGPHGNSTYIGGYHLVRERIGQDVHHLRIAFKDPSEYFGANWRQDFERNGYATAVCGRIGIWGGPGVDAAETGHLIHLVKKEFNGVRMRSRFWLGDVPGIEIPDIRARITTRNLAEGLVKHCVEEMATLASFLPELYERENPRPAGGRHDWLKTVVDG